jgi:methylenetetrahydrofolate reductase (NADPH)
MRDEHKFQSGRKVTYAPRVFFGAAANPFGLPFEWRADRLAKKVAAGAQFIQTQYCYDVPRLREYMKRVEDLGLLDKVFILVGVGPMRSAKVAEWMRTNVPGVHIPDAVIKRMAGAEKQALEGQKICIEIIQEVKEIKGVSGVHVMAYRQEDTVANIIQSSGVLGGRVPWFPGRDTPSQTTNQPSKETA